MGHGKNIAFFGCIRDLEAEVYGQMTCKSSTSVIGLVASVGEMVSLELKTMQKTR